MTAGRLLLLVAAACVAATALGLALGHGRSVGLASVLALAATLAVVAALELRPARRRRPSTRTRENEIPVRLRQIADDLRAAEQSDYGVERSLRPLLVPIVVARLGRRGVDMALAPQRAQALLGNSLWEIVRPDRPSAANRGRGGLAGDELREAIERLERL